VPAVEDRDREWIGVAQLAQELDVPVRTIYHWRSRGLGPRGATFGRHVRFRRGDVEAWIAGRYDAADGA
jgi:excisionase family DNA binding protein